MKHARKILWLTAACLLLALVACGPQEKVIETPAKDINLSAADLGSEWSLQAEQGLDEMPAMKQEHVRDANMRMFGADSITGMAISIVFSTKAVASAKSEMGSDTVRNFGKELQIPGVTLETLPAPGVGDECVMVGGKYADLGMGIYVVTFRKANVIVMLSVVGKEEVVNQELVLGYARTAEARIR